MTTCWLVGICFAVGVPVLLVMLPEPPPQETRRSATAEKEMTAGGKRRPMLTTGGFMQMERLSARFCVAGAMLKMINGCVECPQLRTRMNSWKGENPGWLYRVVPANKCAVS